MGPVFPTPIIELQLDRLWRVFRIEEDIRKQCVVRVDGQRLLGASKEVLRDPLARPDGRVFPTEDRMIGGRDKFPGIGPVALGFGTGSTVDGVVWGAGLLP